MEILTRNRKNVKMLYKNLIRDNLHLEDFSELRQKLREEKDEEDEEEEVTITRIDAVCRNCCEEVFCQLLLSYTRRNLQTTPKQYSDRPLCAQGYECKKQN